MASSAPSAAETIRTESADSHFGTSTPESPSVITASRSRTAATIVALIRTKITPPLAQQRHRLAGTAPGIGVYSPNMSSFDVFVVAAFGLAGYIFMALGCAIPPLIMAFIMGPMLEENFRRSMLLSNGDPAVFVSRPISTLCVLAILAILGSHVYRLVRNSRRPCAAAR